MSPIIDTFNALVHKCPDAFLIWGCLSIAPLAILVALALLYGPKLLNRMAFVRTSFALVIGYPTALILLVVVPLTVFNLFFTPVIFDAYPNFRGVLSAPVSLLNWVAQNAFWSAPIVWLIWLVASPIYLARKWRAHATQG